MPALDDPDRAAVRVAAGDRLRAVHDRDDALLDEPVGGDAVEVAVVDDRDLPGLQARDHVLGAAVDPGHSLHGEGLGLLLEAQQAGHQRRLFRDGRAGPDAPAVSSSSAAWRRAWDESPTPASIRDSSATRSSPSTIDADATVRSARPAVAATTCSTVFSTTTWVPANAATCARCVTQRTWCRAPSVCQQTADRDAGFTADPGVDLVEHQRRRRLRQHHARRQHRTGELAAGRGPGQRSGRLPGVGRQQEHHPVVTVVGRLPRSTTTSTAAWGIASSCRCTSMARASGSAAARRAAVSAAAAACAAAACSRPAALDRGRPFLVAARARRAGPPTPTRRRSRRRGCSRTCGRARGAAGGGARTVLDPLGVLVDPLDLVAQLLLDVGQLALHAPQPCRELGERRPAVERGDRVPERVETPGLRAPRTRARARRGARPRRRAAPPPLRARRPRRDRRARRRRSRPPGSGAGRSPGPGRARHHRGPRARRRARAPPLVRRGTRARASSAAAPA